VTGEENDLWTDIDVQLQVAEKSYHEDGSVRFYSIPDRSLTKLSHDNGDDILTVSGSNSSHHEWRLVMGAISTQRREVAGLGGSFEGTCLQIRFDSTDRFRLVPFLADVVELVHAGSSTDDALSGTLERWHDRFRAIRAPLTKEEQRGLYGELCVLRELLTNTSNNARTWKGPGRSLHDFVADDWHIEVKTSTTMPGRLKISPLNQLEPISERLFLAMVKIRVDDEGGSLPDLIAFIRGLDLSEPDSEHFEEMLSIQRYRDADADRYSSKYSMEGVYHLEISGDTPVLHRVRIDPDVACVNSLRWIMSTESLPFTECDPQFWTDL
jgi:hypothetical protein